MSFAKLEQEHERISIAITKLAIEIEALNRQTEELFEELNITPAQLNAYLQNKDASSDEAWTILMEQRKELDDQIEKALSNVRNPVKAKQSLTSLNVPSYWLHVR